MTGLRRRIRATVDAVKRLVIGLGVAVLALGVLGWTLAVLALCLAGVGLLLAPGALRLIRWVADRERARLTRWDVEILSPGPPPAGLRTALRDPFLRRELPWLLLAALWGVFSGVLGLSLVSWALQDLAYPLYAWAVPADAGAPGLVFWAVDEPSGVALVSLYGVFWLIASLLFTPWLARAQSWPARRLLTAPPGHDLSLRVAELTATRAAALDAHAVELRRIERSLHDGTQNRLVAVNVLLGAARRAMPRDPAAGDELLERAQQAAETALAELRTVVRGILPPVLDDRGLAGALDGLAADCAVPCRVRTDLPGRCAASVEATAYFVTAEALTNVVKHSGAASVTVTARRERDRLLLEVADDGQGGADPDGGSGLSGIRRRVEAYDGRLTLTSPPGGPTTLRVELPCGS